MKSWLFALYRPLIPKLKRRTSISNRHPEKSNRSAPEPHNTPVPGNSAVPLQPADNDVRHKPVWEVHSGNDDELCVL